MYAYMYICICVYSYTYEYMNIRISKTCLGERIFKSRSESSLQNGHVVVIRSPYSTGQQFGPNRIEFYTHTSSNVSNIAKKLMTLARPDPNLCTYIRTYTYTYTCTYTYANAYTYTSTYIHAYVYTHIHIDIRIHIRIHTCSP